jgi:hypothetical protein
MLFATFLSEFQGATLWNGDAPDLILMAPSPPAEKILSRAHDQYVHRIQEDDFGKLGMEGYVGIFGFYLLDDSGLRNFSAGAQINTDDRTLLEYHAPRALLVHGLEDQNRQAILTEQRDPLPGDIPEIQREMLLVGAGVTSVNQDDADGAERFLRALDGFPTTSEIDTLRGRAALARSDYLSALHAFDAALVLGPCRSESTLWKQ